MNNWFLEVPKSVSSQLYGTQYSIQMESSFAYSLLNMDSCLILDFLNRDYRDFIQAKILAAKQKNRHFSYQYCSRKLRTSVGYLKLVIGKKRNISLDKISGLCELFELDDFERQFFTLMVARDLVDEPKVKAYFNGALGTLHARKTTLKDFVDQIPSESSNVTFKNWFNLFLAELTKFSDFQDDPKWIQSKIIDTTVSEDQIQAALDQFKKSNILKFTDQKWVLTNEPIHSPDVLDLDAFKIYKIGFQKALTVLEDAKAYARCGFVWGNYAVNEDEEEKIIGLFNEFREKVEEIGTSSKNPTLVLSISSAYFNLAKRK